MILMFYLNTKLELDRLIFYINSKLEVVWLIFQKLILSKSVIMTSKRSIFHLCLHNRHPSLLIIVNHYLCVDRVTCVVNRGTHKNCIRPIFNSINLGSSSNMTFDRSNTLPLNRSSWRSKTVFCNRTKSMKASSMKCISMRRIIIQNTLQ